ncbi:hypothetical protein RFI_06159, partial [Reticulomyxa filosa]
MEKEMKSLRQKQNASSEMKLSKASPSPKATKSSYNETKGTTKKAPTPMLSKQPEPKKTSLASMVGERDMERHSNDKNEVDNLFVNDVDIEDDDGNPQIEGVANVPVLPQSNPADMMTDSSNWLTSFDTQEEQPKSKSKSKSDVSNTNIMTWMTTDNGMDTLARDTMTKPTSVATKTTTTNPSTKTQNYSNLFGSTDQGMTDLAHNTMDYRSKKPQQGPPVIKNPNPQGKPPPISTDDGMQLLVHDKYCKKKLLLLFFFLCGHDTVEVNQWCDNTETKRQEAFDDLFSDYAQSNQVMLNNLNNNIQNQRQEGFTSTRDGSEGIKSSNALWSSFTNSDIFGSSFTDSDILSYKDAEPIEISSKEGVVEVKHCCVSKKETSCEIFQIIKKKCRKTALLQLELLFFGINFIGRKINFLKLFHKQLYFSKKKLHINKKVGKNLIVFNSRKETLQRARIYFEKSSHIKTRVDLKQIIHKTHNCIQVLLKRGKFLLSIHKQKQTDKKKSQQGTKERKEKYLKTMASQKQNKKIKNNNQQQIAKIKTYKKKKQSKKMRNGLLKFL